MSAHRITGASVLARRSLADQVADALVDLILTSGLQEGDSLPSTADLSEQFGVSRTVVREAIAALAGRGVLTRSQGRETVVATPGPHELNSLLQFRVRSDSVPTKDILECREALEVTSARSAAVNRCDVDLAALDERLATLTDAPNDKAFHEADIELHRAIAVASGNRLLVLILDSLVDFLTEVRVQATRNRRAAGEGSAEVIEQHARVVEAIRAGDPEAAAEAMRAHLGSTAAEFNRHPKRAR